MKLLLSAVLCFGLGSLTAMPKLNSKRGTASGSGKTVLIKVASSIAMPHSVSW